jgi:hypothetical protein
MGALFQDGLADGTVGRNITLTLTLTLTEGVTDLVQGQLRVSRKLEEWVQKNI